MVESDAIRWVLYGAGWFLLLFGGLTWTRKVGKPIPMAYLLLLGILILLQLYSELSF